MNYLESLDISLKNAANQAEIDFNRQFGRKTENNHINNLEMTPRQKAIELKEKYQNIEFSASGFDEFGEHNTCNMGFERVKQCCFITIDEIIKEVESYSTDYSVGSGFWQKVKAELLSF